MPNTKLDSHLKELKTRFEWGDLKLRRFYDWLHNHHPKACETPCFSDLYTLAQEFGVEDPDSWID